MKKQIPIFIAVMSALFGCQPAPAPADMSKAPPTPARSYVEEMRTKYKGDASKLTPEERAQMDQFTHGHTDLAMKMPGKQ